MSKTGKPTHHPENDRVIDFSEARALKLEEKRRKTERIFFRQLIGIYTVTGTDGKMRPIEIVDVSESGLSFQVPFNPEDPWPRGMDEVPLRLYFSQDTYLPLHLKIQNSRPCIDDGKRYVRYGCVVDPNTSTFDAYRKFVSFLETYAEHSHKDTNGVSVFYL